MRSNFACSGRTRRAAARDAASEWTKSRRFIGRRRGVSDTSVDDRSGENDPQAAAPCQPSAPHSCACAYIDTRCINTSNVDMSTPTRPTMPRSQLDLLQGTLDLLILKTLSWGPAHGYAIARWIQQLT